MTDENQAIAPVSNENSIAQPAPVESTPVEKLLPQSDVNRIVADNKRSAYDKGYQAAVSQHSQTQEPASNAVQHTASQAQNLGLDENAIKGIVSSEFNTREQHYQQKASDDMRLKEANRVYGELQNKFTEAKSRYDDFDTVVTDAVLTEIPDIALAASHVSNSADVLYHLSNNLSKVGAIRNLPAGLQALEMQKLSKSLENNQISLQKGHARDPLRQGQASNVRPSTGRKSIADYTTQFTV